MSKMIETYQQRRKLDEKKPVHHAFATVAGINEDGIILKFPGNEEPDKKHYLCNTQIAFRVGDHVKVHWDSNTYIVEYPVGRPKQ